MILKLLAVTLALFAIVLSALWIRSATRDEGIRWESVEVTRELITVDRQFDVAWGPHGLRFWVWFDSCPVGDMFRDITSPKYESGLVWRSEHYKEGSSWGWPEETFWNRRGFWLNRQAYRWDGGHQRHLLLIATPFWLLVLVALAGVGIIFRKRKWVNGKPKALPSNCRSAGQADGSGNLSAIVAAARAFPAAVAELDRRRPSPTP
jgi:hypothetical protein